MDNREYLKSTMTIKITPLKALKQLKERYGKNFSTNDDARCNIIKDALKALDIIKKKPRGLYLIILTKDYEDYIRFCGKYYDFMYDREEYDILKDILQ